MHLYSKQISLVKTPIEKFTLDQVEADSGLFLRLWQPGMGAVLEGAVSCQQPGNIEEGVHQKLKMSLPNTLSLRLCSCNFYLP